MFAVVYLNGFGYREIVATGSEEELGSKYTLGFLNPAPAGEYQDSYGYDEQIILPLREARELVLSSQETEEQEEQEEKTEFQKLIEQSMK